MTTTTRPKPTISLSPVEGLEFFPDVHRYRYQGEWVSHSITTVVNDKTPEQMARIMSTRSEWEPRGNYVHNALERFLTFADPGDPGDYGAWIRPMVGHPMWRKYSAVACEHRMVDARHSIAGSFDALLQNSETGELVLADLKTQSSEHSKPRDISKQLGGYLSLMDQCHRDIGTKVTKCIGIWAKPGKTTITTFEPEDCLENYLAARHSFLSQQPEW